MSGNTQKNTQKNTQQKPQSKKTYTEVAGEYKDAAGEYYNQKYEQWMPWIEDQYLKWFTNDNKASYSTKQNLDKTKVTGNKQVDNLQDGVNNLVSGQVGKGGLAQPLGDAVSKEGINRAERGGKDDKGKGVDQGYGESAAKSVKGGASSVAGGAQSAGQSVAGGAKSAVGSVGGMLGGGGGGGKKQGESKK